MSYHSEGTLTLTNTEGEVSTYKVNTYGDRLVLSSPKGEWQYISDKPAVLVEKIEKEIEDLNDALAQKKELIKELVALI